jgi:hypothetical protein
MEWRRCLRQVLERNGALEIAVAQDHEREPDCQQLVWRVRLLAINEREIVVEQPVTLGRIIPIEKGIQLVAVLSIGQNRWMFATTNLGLLTCPVGTLATGMGSTASTSRRDSTGGIAAMRLVMPESVERCQRRNYYRVETAAINLPTVSLWPLLDPRSVLIAERANEIQYEAELSRGQSNPSKSAALRLGNESHSDLDVAMPEVGPEFRGTLLNMGGGGVGLRVRADDGQALARHKLFWLSMSLPLSLETPICATGKLVHTHMESNHDTYAGMAFDFTYNPNHQRIVVDQICRYIAQQQRSQSDAGRASRRSA